MSPKKEIEHILLSWFDLVQIQLVYYNLFIKWIIKLSTFYIKKYFNIIIIINNYSMKTLLFCVNIVID